MTRMSAMTGTPRRSDGQGRVVLTGFMDAQGGLPQTIKPTLDSLVEAKRELGDRFDASVSTHCELVDQGAIDTLKRRSLKSLVASGGLALAQLGVMGGAAVAAKVALGGILGGALLAGVSVGVGLVAGYGFVKLAKAVGLNGFLQRAHQESKQFQLLESVKEWEGSRRFTITTERAEQVEAAGLPEQWAEDAGRWPGEFHIFYGLGHGMGDLQLVNREPEALFQSVTAPRAPDLMVAESCYSLSLENLLRSPAPYVVGAEEALYTENTEAGRLPLTEMLKAAVDQADARGAAQAMVGVVDEHLESYQEGVVGKKGEWNIEYGENGPLVYQAGKKVKAEHRELVREAGLYEVKPQVAAIEVETLRQAAPALDRLAGSLLEEVGSGNADQIQSAFAASRLEAQQLFCDLGTFTGHLAANKSLSPSTRALAEAAREAVDRSVVAKTENSDQKLTGLFFRANIDGEFQELDGRRVFATDDNYFWNSALPESWQDMILEMTRHRHQAAEASSTAGC